MFMAQQAILAAAANGSVKVNPPEAVPLFVIVTVASK
jgi:hypothetical protein